MAYFLKGTNGLKPTSELFSKTLVLSGGIVDGVVVLKFLITSWEYCPGQSKLFSKTIDLSRGDIDGVVVLSLVITFWEHYLRRHVRQSYSPRHWPSPVVL